jgi:hypothetical protein
MPERAQRRGDDPHDQRDIRKLGNHDVAGLAIAEQPAQRRMNPDHHALIQPDARFAPLADSTRPLSSLPLVAAADKLDVRS